jgi:hypothetical protein
MNILSALKNSLRKAASFNPDVQVAPACILWPDSERQWEPVIAQLQDEMPDLLVLGDYAPQLRRGPAIWLRCALAGRIPEVPVSRKYPSILYLPGVSRQELRAIEDCPAPLKPLAELQYRGVIWSQINAKDWTILAFLVSEHGGLQLDVAKDSDTKLAMLRSLHRLLDEKIESLQGKRLDRDYFNGLLSGGDPVREILMWLDQGSVWQSRRDPQTWSAFVDICSTQYGYNPDTEGVLAGCMRLAQQEGPWKSVWLRYCEAPGRYPNIPDQLRKCTPPPIVRDSGADDTSMSGWPQWNDEQEKLLAKELLSSASLPPHQAREKVLALESEHGHRRDFVWAALGEARLAVSLRALALVASATKTPLLGATVEDIAGKYREEYWRVDHAVLRALEGIWSAAELDAVKAVLHAVYLPWLTDAARHLQHIVSVEGYPMREKWSPEAGLFEGECILFVDGLRFDVAKRLTRVLELQGFNVTEHPQWAALPSVTATAKPAVSPVASAICGGERNQEFQPSVCGTGQPLNQYHLKKLLQEAGWGVVGSPSFEVVTSGRGWHEYGDVDQDGHAKGWKLARQLDTLVQEVGARISELLASGWKRVRVVTDHGWLLMPGGLPKVELSSVLTENKWGRCAMLKPGASCNERLFPWFWDAHVDVALADGVGCFKKGMEYAHGGLSVQECYTLHLLVDSGDDASSRPRVSISNVFWRGLRCNVVVDMALVGVTLDIRLHAAKAESSVLAKMKTFQNDDAVSVLVLDDDLEGKEAVIVLLDQAGNIITELKTIIGGK